MLSEVGLPAVVMMSCCCYQIPIFPVVKKDLTFIHLGNDSYVDGLVNFEKLRMIAKEIRHTANMCSARYVSTRHHHGNAVAWQHAIRPCAC